MYINTIYNNNQTNRMKWSGALAHVNLPRTSRLTSNLLLVVDTNIYA